MGARKKGLGRGLDALLSGTIGSAPEPGQAPSEHGVLRELPVDLIDRGRYQPRTHMDEDALEELAASIRAHGVVQPVTVRPVPGGRYELVAGERRWRGAQLAGLSTVPAMVRELADEAALPIGIIENIQREDLNAVEEANALRRLIDEFGLTHQAVADAIGRSRTAVSNMLRLLDLNPDVLALLDAGELEMGSARALLALPGARQSEAARVVVHKGMSTRETERMVRRLLAEDAGEQDKSRRPAATDPDVRRLEQELSDRLGTAVHFQQRRGGAGRVVIDYGSLDQLEGILGQLRGN